MPKSRFSEGKRSIRFPSIRISPCVRGIRPARQFSAVDFPQPDGPSSAMNSPARIVRLRSTNASRPPNLRPTSFISRDSNALADKDIGLLLELSGPNFAVPDVEGLYQFGRLERCCLRHLLDQLVVPVPAVLLDHVLARLRCLVKSGSLNRRAGIEVSVVVGHGVE